MGNVIVGATMSLDGFLNDRTDPGSLEACHFDQGVVEVTATTPIAQSICRERVG